MEIHAPHEPILSVKEALIHLGIVTIGILIALSLEGLVEWQHHRHLIAEANENITHELEDNDREVRSFLNAVPTLRSDDTAIIHFIDAALAHQAPQHGELKLNFIRSDLSTASWTTAETIGALGLMNYQDVKRFAAAYELQDEFSRLQSRTIDAVISATTLFEQNVAPDKSPSAELQAEREKILNVMSELQAEEQIAQALDKRYQSVLGRH